MNYKSPQQSAFSRNSLYTFYSRNPTCKIPPCQRISNRKYSPMPSEFHNREPPLPFGNPKSCPWLGMDIFWKGGGGGGFAIMEFWGHGEVMHFGISEGPRCMISKGNHVKFARFVMLAVSELRSKNMTFFLRSMYNKTIIRFGFCDIQNNRGLGKGYQPQPDNPYLDLNYSGYHKNFIQ